MAGFLTYFSIFALTAIWTLGWAGASYVGGAFFDLPMKTTILAGALLGPLGFVVIIATGVLERGSRQQRGSSFPDNAVTRAGDGPDDWNLF
jgi:hypothetical protein